MSIEQGLQLHGKVKVACKHQGQVESEHALQGACGIQDSAEAPFALLSSIEPCLRVVVFHSLN